MGIDRASLRGPLKAAIERALAPTGAAVERPGAAPKRWSNAKPTDCDGIRFASRTEARVYRRLADEIREPEKLFCQVRLPLLVLGPGKGRRPVSTITVDFAVTRGGKLARLIDAKCPGRISREWHARAAACRETWGIKIEEVER